MGANRRVHAYTCPDQAEFTLTLPPGATFLGFRVVKDVEALFEIDPEASPTVAHNYKRVAIDENYTAAGHAWKGFVDFRGQHWFLVKVNP